MTPIKYKPHIDGLRAVAVLLVIFHHLGDWLGTPGGYVGVDVFFVISGLLVTSIVKTEIEAGRFSFGRFYKRRVVRLAPAYFTVLLATTIAAVLWMLPAELLSYSRSAIASSVFVANFHMWKEVGGYFGGDADVVPLLHLWSLAVEEQFYLFWPLALLIAHRLFAKRWLPWLIVAVVIAGTAASQLGVLRAPAAAYYLLPTRFFELAIGALLAYVPDARVRRPVATFMSLAGVTMVVYAAVSYDKETLFPGYAALAPVLGTAMLLRWGEGTVVGAALSMPAATLIGRISYPAYLWHWPIIVFLNINGVQINVPIGLGVLTVTLGLSWMTYQWLELPARRFLALPPWKVVVGGAGVPIAVVMAGSFALIALDGLPSRFPDSLNRKSEALLAAADKLRGRCNHGPPEDPLPPAKCILGRGSGKVDFLLVGDSHANHFTGFLDVLAEDANLRGYDMTRSNTPFMPRVELAMFDEPEYNRNFEPRNRYVSDLLTRESYDLIILAGAYETFYNRNLLSVNGNRGIAAFEQGMRAALRESVSAADRVIVFTQVPKLEGGLHDCSLRAERFHRDLECTMPAEGHRASAAAVNSFFDRLKLEFPRVEWIELDKIMCDEKRCLTEMDGVPLYKDDGHLNDLGSRLLARRWMSRFGNPLNFPVVERRTDSP